MATKSEVLTWLVEMQSDLINKPNLLNNKDAMGAWVSLTKLVKNKEKVKIQRGFEYLENVIHRNFRVPPGRLLLQRKRYASGKEIILSILGPSGPAEVQKSTGASPVSPSLAAKTSLPGHQTDTGEPHRNYVRQAQVARGDVTEREMEYEKRIENLETELKVTKAKLRQTEMRLKDKIRDDTPLMAVLSNPNRPMKLAEKYVELFDNEWTDAMDTLLDGGKDERKVINILLAILKFCYRECERLADNQLSQLEIDCYSLQTPYTQQEKQLNGSEETKRFLLDAQHSSSLLTMGAAVESVTVSISMRKDLNFKEETVKIYTTECIKICWSMVTHHPGLFLLWPDDSKETKIRFDMFRPYHCKGDYMDYLVFPALLLHNDGPLLTKGTVQPIGR